MKPAVRFDISALDKFVKDLDYTKGHVVKIGILGSKVARGTGKGGLTNADIGAKHEYGSFTERVPQRSFLRMPLFMKSQEILENTRKNSMPAILAGNFKLVLGRLGVACETVIGHAFASGGFGQWKPLAESTVEAKGHDLILIQTRQLERAITSTVVKK